MRQLGGPRVTLASIEGGAPFKVLPKPVTSDAEAAKKNGRSLAGPAGIRRASSGRQ